MDKLIAKMVMLALASSLVAACGGGGGSSSGITKVPTYKIAGSVTSGGTGLSGATVTLEGLGTATAFTNSSGNYTFTGLPNGNYAVTVTKPDYSCTPKTASYTVQGASVLGANFTASPSSTVFYVIDEWNQLAVLDIAAKTAKIIGNTQAFLNDIAFDSSGTLYGISGDQLYRVDPSTAVATSVGPLGIVDTTSLEFGPDGKLYTANTSLDTVNPVTGAATTIGHGGAIAYRSSGDLAFLGSRMYLTSIHDPTTDALFRLNPTTGAGTFVGYIGFPNVYGLSTNDNVTLYGFTGNKVIKIDPATGAGTLVWDFTGQSDVKNIDGAAAH
jgi:hypothetical protein